MLQTRSKESDSKGVSRASATCCRVRDRVRTSVGLPTKHITQQHRTTMEKVLVLVVVVINVFTSEKMLIPLL